MFQILHKSPRTGLAQYWLWRLPESTSGMSNGLPWSMILSNSSKLVSVMSSLNGVVFAISFVSHIYGKLPLTKDLNSFKVSGSGAINWFIMKQRSRSILWPTTGLFANEIFFMIFEKPVALSNSFSSLAFFSSICMVKRNSYFTN